MLPSTPAIPSETSIQVPEGSTSSFTLPDGTSVILNSGSRLSYLSDFGSTHRDVRLDGEAYFDVIHNEELPFRVNTDRLIVTDLGTALICETSILPPSTYFQEVGYRVANIIVLIENFIIHKEP